MRKICFSFVVLWLCIGSLYSQNMTPTKLNNVLTSVSDSIIQLNNQWKFSIKGVPFICIADSTHNRMRIISPIAHSNKLTEELKTASLIANFHTALDVKYAITDDILWSVFIHPLKELSEAQLLDAMSQVYYANVTFGTTFSSTALVFPGKKPKPKPPIQKNKNLINKI
ncbi:conserved exported protein of unknown function [Tenacibaculum sp. 190130A14a]|uniref:Uncharacterized protein n=1 Tax=Tenacibaculum polynesiense TaxID=3137857 RepID=A0ABP1EWJ4_9FLAO